MKKLLVFFIMMICSNPLYVFGSIIKWDASTGDVSGYTIYYGISQGNYPFSENVGNVTQYSLSNFSLTEGTAYYFVVRAHNDFGESDNSNVTRYVVPSTGDNTPPLPPQSVTSEIKDGNILLSWATSDEVDIFDYRVYYCTSSRNYGLPIAVDKNEYLISGLDSNKTYYFAVTAVDASGNESGYSSEIKKSISLQIEPTPFVQEPNPLVNEPTSAVQALTPVVQQVTNIATNAKVSPEKINLPSFDKAYYLSAKLAQKQANDSSWIGKTIDDLEYFLNSGGFTPESHYSQYGYIEGLEPNQYFSHSEYILAKAIAMYNAGGYSSVYAAKDAFSAAWPYDAYQHYLLYGAAEGLNPSNSFDESEYLADKLAVIQASFPEWSGKMIDDLRSLLTSLGMTALDHYLTYGQYEGLNATPVSVNERVEE